jgi:hypothetical protein
MIRGSVRRQAGFDIKDVSPIAHSEHCFIPALFVAGENDDFIPKTHSLMLHDLHAGDANMIVVDGDHNSTRPRFMFDSVSIFLQACLQIPLEWQLRIHPSMNITSPPWRYPGAPKERDEADSMLSIQQQTSMQSVTSPTRPSLEDKEDEINRLANAEEGTTDSLDDTNIDVENLGMTSERQKEIQGSLFRMLGHENDGGDGSDD